MEIKVFKQKPILGILRGVEISLIEPLVETVIAAGLTTLEITMNTAQAPDLIRKAVRMGAKRLAIGAGTVLSQTDLKSALESGASFIVLPVLIQEVVEYCVKNKIPVFPGALTAQEIYQAHLAGATMVKVFPVNSLGPEYLRQIKGPFPGIELLACGGVTAGNLEEYFASGASAVTFGASIFRKDWLAQRNFTAIGRAIKDFIGAWEKLAEKCLNLPQSG